MTSVLELRYTRACRERRRERARQRLAEIYPTPETVPTVLAEQEAILEGARRIILTLCSHGWTCTEIAWRLGLRKWLLYDVVNRRCRTTRYLGRLKWLVEHGLPIGAGGRHG